MIQRHDHVELAAQGAAPEDDLVLVREASAFYLKLSEALLREVPDNLPLSEAVATGFTQYAYAFVAFEAERLDSKDAKAAQALTKSYFDAIDMIKAEPAKANEIMGAAVKQTGEQFAKSSSFLRWQDKAANQKFFGGELQAFMKDAGTILLEAGVIRKAPTDFSVMFDTSFIK